MIKGLGLGPYPTPFYELNSSVDVETEGFRGCDVCSPPEPYPIRTALPLMAQPRCPQQPYVVFLPATYEDAQSAIDIIREYGQKFTILSGGHDYECQSASPDGALIITSLLNKVEIDYENELVTIGAGVLWQTVYDKLHEDANPGRYGVMGAQCGFVSVSGYTLGGGVSWHMSKIHGMGAESAIGMKIVTADGSLVDATTTNDYSDLRWAMAGSGGMNIAMAVEFTYELKKSREGNYFMIRWEYRFLDEPSRDGEYTIDMIKDIMTAWTQGVDEIKDNPDVGTVQVRLRTESYGHRLQINAPCNDCDLRESPVFTEITEKYPPRKADLEKYASINDYVKSRRNTYPGTADNPRVSNFVKGSWETIHKALETHFDFYILDNEDDRAVAGSDLNLYMINGFIKKPELVSLNPDVADASWHFTIRAKHPTDPDLLAQIRCKNRALTEALKKSVGKNDYLGPYWNYFDSTADKKDYYGKAFKEVMKIKDIYDPDNLFTKIKGIKVNDDDMRCLEEFCKDYNGYWED
mmetsp:Transcript_18261/g.26783  ORF Transcript_18261/g.26783 Transcript_18261/m.26783 type:complete len:522 (-) Transcript_18261:207-1772(-)